MKVRKKKLLEEFEKLDQKLSNPKELIHFTTKLTANLAPVWDSGDYYEKQIFQNTLFPAGLGYDLKKEHYRTTKINGVIGYTSQLSKNLEQIKKPDFSNLLEKSGSVPGIGLEPIRPQWTQDFKSCVSTNSTTWAFSASKKIPLKLEGN